MDILSMIFLAIGLAMDAFSVSVTRGLTLKLGVKHALIIALSSLVSRFLCPF